MINPRLFEVLRPSIATPESENPHKISFSCDKNAEAQLAAEAALRSGKGANKRSRISAQKQAKKCSKKQKWVPTAEEGENVMLGGFSTDKMNKNAFISNCMLEEELKLESNGDPKWRSQLEKSPFEMVSLFKDDNSDDKISFFCDKSAEAELATEAALLSNKGTNKTLCSFAPKQAKKCSEKQKQEPTAEDENGLLGGFHTDETDEDAFISKCILEEDSKLEFDGDPKWISQLEKFLFETSETESLFKDDGNDDKISFSCDNSVEAQPATEAALPSCSVTNKRSCNSSPEQAKKCSRKQKRAPTAQKGEHALLGGFPADKMDKDTFISKCMLEDESELKFNCNPKSISQLKKLPFETESLFKDDSSGDKIPLSCDNSAEAQRATVAALPSGKGGNRRSRHSAPKQAKKCSRKQKQVQSKLKSNCNPKFTSQLEKLPSETESLFKDDSNGDKISFSCDDGAEAQPATEAALPSVKGANKRPRRSAPKRAKKCGSRKRKRAPTAQKGEHALIGGFDADELDEDTSILKDMVEGKQKLEFSCDPKSISQFEKSPFETESLFNDDSNNDWWTRIPTLDNLLLDM
jgi:hypothetical protein